MRLILAAAMIAVLGPSVAVAQQRPGERTTVALADGWRFKQDDALAGAEAQDFPDADWASVSVPHTWNTVGYYLPNPATHLNRREAVNKIQGIGWYRLAFTAPSGQRGRRSWLEFDAASRIATVWLNGRRLGSHAGGFSRFRLDATAALRPGARNLLAVRVDNTKPAPGSTTADTLPLTGDFFVYGGLYRPVRLISMNAVHIDMLDHGGPGVYAATRTIVGARASVGVDIGLRNDASTAATVRVVTRLIDANGRTASEQVQAVAIAADGGSRIRQTLDVPDAHLWQGVGDPYLYRLTVDVVGTHGRMLDRVDQAYGIRQMRFDPAQGLLLNGKPYALHGVGYHQDREGKGWAIDAADTAQDVALLREMGANTIRLTHYQHGQPIHDLADRYGLIVWDEIPLVSQWTLGGAKEASAGLRENARQQLTEEIRQNGNHASVANWGIANEVDFGNSLPAFLSGATGTPPDPLPLLRELNTLEHELDPGRPSSLATCCEGRLFAPGVDVPVTAPVADVSGANRYFGWYYGTSKELGPALDALHAKRPDQTLAVTEYGGGGGTTIHTDNVLGGPVDSRGRLQPEEVESWIHEGNWAVLTTKPYLWASWLWSGFDFASTVRQEGDAQDLNTKGLMTFDRKIRKDAYFFYKANWSSTPTVYVTGRRYAERAYATTDVRVYSNATATELTVNGVSIGTLPACPEKICVWHDVRLAPGTNHVVAHGVFARGPLDDAITWHLGEEVAHAVRIDAGALVAARSGAGLFGSDNFFTGGMAATVDKPADYGKPVVPTPITGTADTAIAATYRRGTFAYHVPLDDGSYTVTLTFVEPSAAPGERIFDVLANGVEALPAFDVAKAAGRPLSAIRRSFPVTVRGGALDLAFRPSKGEAIVSAVEIQK